MFNSCQLPCNCTVLACTPVKRNFLEVRRNCMALLPDLCPSPGENVDVSGGSLTKGDVFFVSVDLPVLKRHKGASCPEGGCQHT